MGGGHGGKKPSRGKKRNCKKKEGMATLWVCHLRRGWYFVGDEPQKKESVGGEHAGKRGIT